MQRRLLLFSVIPGMALLSAGMGRADVPAPPVNQTIGKLDVATGSMVEADCRACHDPGLPDRHHLLYGQPIPDGSMVPYPDADRDGSADAVYGCVNCHGRRFTVVRDCIACHTENAHHASPAAKSADCKSCHGAIIDNIGDGHYIPTGALLPSTPSASGGTGLPYNSRGKGAGACDYCHDDDGGDPPVILTNMELHHGASDNCMLCHAVHNPTQMRKCEGCHGPDSLHSIQADSPRAPIGTIVVGGEDAGYGHVGRDAGPGDSDCWGCHGFATPPEPPPQPPSGPVCPTIHSTDLASFKAGADTMVVLSGAAFTNYSAGALFESDVSLTGPDGSSVILTPDLVDERSMAVTIPGDTAPGNYDLRAVKTGFESNPAPISIVPEVVINKAVSDQTVTIRGSGFGGYAEGSSGSFVTATVPSGTASVTGGETFSAAASELGRVLSWSDTRIKVEFSSIPKDVTIYSVFGAATSGVVPDPDKSTTKKKRRNRKKRRRR